MIPTRNNIRTAATVKAPKPVYIAHLSSAINSHILQRATQAVIGFPSVGKPSSSLQSRKLHQPPPGNTELIKSTHLRKLPRISFSLFQVFPCPVGTKISFPRVEFELQMKP